MKAATLLGAALAAATVHAGVRCRGTGLTQPQELSDLIEEAKSRVLQDLTDRENKLREAGETPRCTVDKLVFRRE